MALKNHSLDEKIVNAAKSEFLLHGFQKASLRKIAEKAGITTGALYTRYENKDILFKSLVSKTLIVIKENLEPLHNNYTSIKDNLNVDKIMIAIKKEEEAYLDVMFKYYDECTLFFCKSDGSSVQTMIQNMMKLKAQQTVSYLHSIAKHEFDDFGVEFILSMQFYYYREILQKGYDKDKAIKCMKTVENFLYAGWKDLFEKIL